MMLFGISYFFIALFVRKTVRTNNKHIVYNQNKAIKVIQESLGGIREIILDNSQDIYINQFKEADIPLRRYGSVNNFIGQFPRYTMETIGIIVIALLAYYLTNESGSIQTVLPILGAIGVGSQRILPAIQQLYNGWASLTGNYNQLADIVSTLNYPISDKRIKSRSICFTSSLELLNISFQYTSDSPLVLNNVNLLINKGLRIGFIGKTGAGKSTLLDIIMGLLMPTSGEILVDGNVLRNEYYLEWQSKIAHVPQNIFLSDCSIAENIAFGIHPDMIDIERVRSVADIALVSEFVSEYPNKYNTIVGERGINLSGGQRQRIGIARALYKNAEILILDEATSALDNLTESKVMKGIMSLNRNLTLFIIAHRLSTLQDCDYLIEVRDGHVLLKNTSEIFTS
jgi:ABC-type bacteriocin/lantibiotic exporter with double-glycine peptidase domain